MTPQSATNIATDHDEAAFLNRRYDEASSFEVLHGAITDHFAGRIALVSSFGAEAAVTLKLVSMIDRNTPVIFLETGKHFAETLHYVEQLESLLGLTDLRVVRPSAGDLLTGDPYGILNCTNTDRCCELRKVKPLERALAGFDAWITGRKRFHGGNRNSLALFDYDLEGRVKVNPLANWTPAQIDQFFALHRLPRHPLVAKGYTSIGCEPCTQRATDDTDLRSGRWAGQGKTECGIHTL